MVVGVGTGMGIGVAFIGAFIVVIGVGPIAGSIITDHYRISIYS
jgi:hypothetical protein